jgi:hypothetical protein
VTQNSPQEQSVESGHELPGFDATVPNPARMWNYWLGGKDNYAADREAAEKVAAAMPSMPVIAQAARWFVIQTVRQLADGDGIRQFLDIGTGLPVADSTHEVAQRAAPESRVVYVDNDRCKSGCMHACTDGRSTVGTGPSETVGHSATRALVSP